MEIQNDHIDFEKRPEICLPMDGNDANYVSRLSTVLVASIQEAKDQISQVEYIFCRQLYPNFQNSSKCLQKLYSEARTAAEDEWKVRVSELENQLKEVCVEKEHVLVECNAVKTEKLVLLRRVAELEEVVVMKTKEVDKRLQLHDKLLDLVKSKNDAVRSQELLMKAKDEKINLLLEKFRELEDKIVALNIEVQQKNEEINKEKETRKELLRQIESQMEKIASNEQIHSGTEKEKKQLVMQLKNLEASSSDLLDELKRKTLELDELIQLREQLIQLRNKNEIELTRKDQKLSICEKEKQALLSRINHLENKVEELQGNSKNRISAMPNSGDLAKELKLKIIELEVESQKRKDTVISYKKLKSQQIFLLKKLGLTKEDMLVQMNAEEQSDKSSNDNKIVTSPEIKRRISVNNALATDLRRVKKEVDSVECSDDESSDKSTTPPEIKRIPVNNALATEMSKVKEEVDSMETCDDEISGRLNQMSNSRSPPSPPAAVNWTTKKGLASSAGIKRPAPGWRETRSRQSPGGADPHDDFLDTPLENIKGNLHKAMQDNAHALPAQTLKEASCNSSDDETQDMRPRGPEKQRQKTLRTAPANFKFVEPVRKKSERENLNGIECHQCKKFYDAVLCDADGKDGDSNKQSHRCEHHDGVSRHRYRFAPPMTPEGFWNIGFDTES